MQMFFTASVHELKRARDVQLRASVEPEVNAFRDEVRPTKGKKL